MSEPTGTVDYDSNVSPFAYRCGACGRGNRRLWRDTNTAARAVDLRCVECAEPDAAKRATLADSDQIAGLVPAVPTEDGGTFWGYSSVPAAGVEWWYRLPCAAAVRAGRTAMTAAEARAADTKHEAEREAWRTKNNADTDRRMREAFAVVDATDYEQTCLWSSWHGRPIGPPVSWEQINLGARFTIGEFGGMPVCVSVTFAIVEGALVAFVEPTSAVVDHRMVDEWKRRTFTGAKSWTNAQNFHNAVIDIRTRR